MEDPLPVRKAGCMCVFKNDADDIAISDLTTSTPLTSGSEAKCLHISSGLPCFASGSMVTKKTLKTDMGSPMS